MSKIFVKKTPNDDKVPFLRGILTQSMVKAGIDFDDAYLIAQQVKDGFADQQEVITSDLEAQVGTIIEDKFGKEAYQRYRHQDRLGAEITVSSPTGREYFSIGLLTRSLEACAIPSEVALTAARCVYEDILLSGATNVESDRLQGVIYQRLHSSGQAQGARRYIAWKRFKKSRRPLIILLGGVTGAGKSTISSELSYRLSITGIQSTDLMREIIRSYLTPAVTPTLGYSSFEAWRGLKMTTAEQGVNHDTTLMMGFLSQIETMRPALEATLKRALKEGHSLILEGVHILPNRLDLESIRADALVIPVIVATMNKEVLRKRFLKRESEHSARRASRYIAHFDDIWELQTYLLSEADETGIPIINSGNTEEAIAEILEVISKIVVKQYGEA